MSKKEQLEDEFKSGKPTSRFAQKLWDEGVTFFYPCPPRQKEADRLLPISDGYAVDGPSK